MQRFIQELNMALWAYLEPMLEEKPYIDDAQITGGDILDRTLSCALLESLCMILVFTPTYFSKQHPYCTREYQLMKRIEEARLREINRLDYGLIIPIIFRGSNKLPAELKERFYYDFSKYTLVEPEISKNRQYTSMIGEIVEKICEIDDLLKEKGEDPCDTCDNFKLPSEDEVKHWLSQFTPTGSSRFPGR